MPEKIVNSQLMEELALETSPVVWIVVFQWKDGSATSVPMDGSNEVEDMIDYVKTSN